MAVGGAPRHRHRSQAQAAQFAGQDSAGALLGALAGIETAGADTLAAIRQLVGLLRDPDDSGAALAAHEPISRLVERFAAHGPAIDLRLPASSPSPAWPPEVASAIYRVVQESLTNIARHAPGARSVAVTITGDARQARAHQPGDRSGAAHLAQHGQDAHRPRPGQARRPQPGGDRRLVLGAP